jgi:hypothetical protein
LVDNDISAKAWRDGLSEGPDCLTPGGLERVLAEECSGVKSFAPRHLDGCAHCQAELAMLRSFELAVPSEEEASSLSWITGRLRSTRQRTARASASAPARRLLSFPRFSYLSGGAAVAATLALAFSLYISDRPPTPSSDVTLSTAQTMRSGRVRLTAPAEDVDQAAPTFRWEAYPGAASYVVEVLEVDGTVVWTGSSSQAFLASGPALAKEVHPGKPLLWRVTALNGSGESIASSDRESFRLDGENRGRARGK